MKMLKKILLSFLVLIVVMAGAAIVFISYLSHRAVPDYNKDISLQGLHAPVEVYRDSFAVPHVYAQDEHDLYLAVGFLLAQDRLWQMDLLRHVTEGRLSEIFGKDYVETDLLLRALRFSKKSEKLLSSASPESRAAILAFSDGVNQYITQHARRLPPEFSILQYKPAKWEPVHTLNMIGYMAWDLKAGWSEILLNEIRQKVDSLRYAQLLPDLIRQQPVVFSGFSQISNPLSALPDLLLHNKMLQNLGTDMLEASNNWAVHGTRSNTGMPLLANDMHLGLSIPGIWYQMHQVVKDGLNVTGLVLPGAPLIICGHNDSIAWGMTNTYVDNLDFYEERINPADSQQYEFNGKWKNFEVEKVIIQVGKDEKVEKLLRFTHRGAVVSSFKKMTGKVVSMHWVGDEMSDEFRCVFLLNRANNWHDFTTALRTFISISQNIAYADKKGNIGLYCAAGVPIRNRDIGFGVLPGYTDAYDWKGYVPFEELPHLFNPPNGFVVSANNRTVAAGYPYHIGSWYSLPHRFERITEMLSAKPSLSVADFKAIQLDQHSKLAEKYMPVILKALYGYDNMGEMEKMAFSILKDWDYSMGPESIAASIYETLYLQFIRCTFSDELGEDMFARYNGITSISRNATDQIIDLINSPWFDDVTTGNRVESLDNNIICAFTKAVTELQDRLGNDPESWEWGKIHNLVLKHPLSSVKILDRIFNLNRESIPVGGSFHTVAVYGYDPGKAFDASQGSSHRHIYDVGNWDNSLTAIPTGNSGIPASRHYCDQTDMFVNGKYHPDYFSRDKIVANARYHMTFGNN